MRAVIALLDEGRTGEALAAMLQRWRECPDPSLAHEIERLSDAITAVLDVPTQHNLWLARCSEGHPSDLGGLIAGCIDEGKNSRLRLDRLLELPPDPRMFWFFGWCERSLGDEERWYQHHGTAITRIFRLAVHTADPRWRPALKGYREDIFERLQFRVAEALDERLGRVLQKLPEVDLPPLKLEGLPSAVDRALAQPLDAVFARPPRQDPEADLRAQIYQNPDQDGPIEIWADLLNETGDPLGEVVTAQLAADRGLLTKAQRTQADRKLRGLLGRMLGPLAGAVHTPTAVFRRGVLFAAKATTTDKTLLDHPAWNTVRCLHGRTAQVLALPGVSHTGIRLVPDPDLRHGMPRGFRLQNLKAPPWTQWVGLAKKGRELQGVTTMLPNRPFQDSDVAALRQAMPGLERLHLIESLPYSSVRDTDPTARLQIPLDAGVLNVPHLVVEARTMQGIDGLLARLPNPRLTVITGHLWCIDRDDGHLDLTIDQVEHHAFPVCDLIGDPAQYTSITVRSRPIPPRLHDALETELQGCAKVKLPRVKR